MIIHEESKAGSSGSSWGDWAGECDQARTSASATTSMTSRHTAVTYCVVMTTCCHVLSLPLLPRIFIITIYEYRGCKAKDVEGCGGRRDCLCKNFVTFAPLWQQPQPIIDKHPNAPSINNDGLFMNLAKCFMNLFLFITSSPQDSPIIFWLNLVSHFTCSESISILL